MSTSTYKAPASGVIEALGSAVRYSSIDEVPDLVIRVVNDDIWREFTTKMNNHVVHETFESFVESEPLAGIGTTISTLRRICTGSVEALDALDRALQRPKYLNRPRADLNNIKDPSRYPEGTSAEQALRRLRKDRPDLHSEVLAGNLSAHAAMVDAGFRPRTLSVRLDDPERTAASLRRNASPEFLAALKEALS